MKPIVADLTAAAQYLDGTVRLLHQLGELYRRVSDFDRRQLNQAVSDRFYIDDQQASSVLQPRSSRWQQWAAVAQMNQKCKRPPEGGRLTDESVDRMN